MILICSIADDGHFGHVMKVVFARLHCAFLISILWISALNHVDILISVKLSIYLYPFIYHLFISVYLYQLTITYFI